MPDPAVELGDDRRPVRRDSLDQRLEVRWPDVVDGAGIDIGGERGPRERSISAVRAAEDRDPFPVRPALLYGVADRVGQVVLHLSAPFPVAGVDECLAVTGRSAVIDLKAEITAVGEPLRVRVEPPDIPGP